MSRPNKNTQMDERALLTYPTWERYAVLAHVVSELSMRDRRALYQIVRNSGSVNADLFFPQYGFTLSEFAVWNVLDGRRKK